MLYKTVLCSGGAAVSGMQPLSHATRAAGMIDSNVMRSLLLSVLLGSSSAAFGQLNLSGVWSNQLHEDWPDRLFGPELGDYGGVPLNEAGRLRATSWSASLITLPEYQCRVHPSDYASSFADFR